MNCLAVPLATLPSALILNEWRALQQKNPLVHVLTNQVVQELTANVLLAAGASPAMVIATQEISAFTALANALLINVGTLTEESADLMRQAILCANAQHIPWTLDPVAVGAITWRTTICQEFIQQKPAAIRGNASEIMALAGLGAGGRGVDSTAESQAALTAAQELARHSGAIVAITGNTDYITDGHTTWATPWGHPIMTRVVGMGCSLSALVAAMTACSDNRLAAVASACAIAGICGQLAQQKSNGPGSFKAAYLDALYAFDEQTITRITS